MIMSEIGANTRGDLGVLRAIDIACVEDVNAGLTSEISAAGGAVFLQAIVLYSTGANTNGTSFVTEFEASEVVTVFDATDSAVANLNAAGKQISWTVGGVLRDTQSISITYAGGAATAATLRLAVVYAALEDGAYLVED